MKRFGVWLVPGLAGFLGLALFFVLRERSSGEIQPTAPGPISAPTSAGPIHQPGESTSPVSVPSPATASSEDPSKLRSLLDRILKLAARMREGKATREEMKEFYQAREEFSLLAWKDASLLREVLKMAAILRSDPAAVAALEEALDKGVSNGILRKQRVALDPALTLEVARLFLGEAASVPLRSLYLAILRCDLNQELERNVFKRSTASRPLDLQSLEAILEITRAVRNEALTRSALYLAGNYSDLSAPARSFVEGVILDPGLPLALRLSALSGYHTGQLTPERLAIAQSLLKPENDPALRQGALQLLLAFGDRPPDPALRATCGQLLLVLATDDPSPALRAEAGRSLAQLYSDPATTAAMARRLETEPDPKVRSDILKGYAASRQADREEAYAVQDVALKVFEKDPDEDVRRAAVGAYMALITQTVISESDTADLRTLHSIQQMASILTQRPPAAETKLLIKRNLETRFERAFPELRTSEPYLALKRLLDP